MNTVELRIGWEDFISDPPSKKDRDVDVTLLYDGETYGFVESGDELYIMHCERLARFAPKLGKVKSFTWLTGNGSVHLQLQYENLWVFVPFLTKEERERR
jgi:hypothetical protein